MTLIVIGINYILTNLVDLNLSEKSRVFDCVMVLRQCYTMHNNERFEWFITKPVTWYCYNCTAGKCHLHEQT